MAAARTLVNTRFVALGRDAERGLDCVGLVALALGRTHEAPSLYALRNSDSDRWMAMLDGLAARRNGAAQGGDIMLFQAGPAQLHLGIWTGSSLIHADARLRRVVEMPGEPGWPILGVWQPN